jgi:hypothetical protein
MRPSNATNPPAADRVWWGLAALGCRSAASAQAGGCINSPQSGTLALLLLPSADSQPIHNFSYLFIFFSLFVTLFYSYHGAIF